MSDVQTKQEAKQKAETFTPGMIQRLVHNTQARLTNGRVGDKEWVKARQEAADALRQSEAPYTQREEPEIGAAEHGDLYCYESNGYSYWMVMDTYGGIAAHELLPREMDPREKPVREIQEKSIYMGRAESWFILRWHQELFG